MSFGINICAQKLDSLQQLLKKSKEDTNKVKTYNVLSLIYINNGSYDSAMQYASKAITLAQKINFKNGEASAFNKIGRIYYGKGDYANAIANQFKSLTCAEQSQNKRLIANAYDEIASIHDAQRNYEKAINYYTKSLELRKKLNDKAGLASSYNNIGIMYDSEGRYNKALDYYNKGLKLNLEIKNDEQLAINYANIGFVYKELAEYDKATEYNQKSIDINIRYGYVEGECAGYLGLGEISYLQKKYKQANEYYNRAIKMAKDLGLKDYLKNGYIGLTGIDSANGNYKFAFENYKKFIIYRDSLNNEESTRKTIEEQFKYEKEKEEAVIKAEQDKKDAAVASEHRRQQLYLWLIAIAGAGVTVVALLIFRNLQQNKKAKQIIEIKNKEVEEKQKEIIDSITYAKRLQKAILPSEEEIKKHIPASFVYYQPKDIVAGDFYWMHTSNDAIYIAAADCTGHGVPGAMVSVVCSNALNRAVNEFNLIDTGSILDKTRELVIATFEKSDAEVKDGMDISLIRLKKNANQNLGEENTEIQWSGANNPLWYILNNELIEVKADKQPIGKYSEPKPFTSNILSFDKSITLYLFSDGYADQFSMNDKKLMKKKFKDIIISIQNLPMDEQKKHLDKFHIDWKGNMEQTDDVLVIGVKI